MILVV
jgi:5-methylcytosine-specific restriction protein A